MQRRNKIIVAVYFIFSLPKMMHIQQHKPIFKNISSGLVTNCHPEPHCIVTDIPKRDHGIL